MYRYTLISLYLALALVVTGCSLIPPGLDQDETEEPDFDQQLQRVTYEVPAFGGISFGGAEPRVENLIVYLLEAGRQETARTVLRDVFGDEADLIDLQVRDQKETVATEELKRSLRRDVLYYPDVISLDYDETVDRISVGLLTAEPVTPVEQIFTDRGIPLEAVILGVEEPVRAL